MKVQELEVTQRKKLDRLRQKSPADRAQLTMAETELQKASVKASASTKSLEQLIDKFEEEKLKDLKVHYANLHVQCIYYRYMQYVWIEKFLCLCNDMCNFHFELPFIHGLHFSNFSSLNKF